MEKANLKRRIFARIIDFYTQFVVMIVPLTIFAIVEDTTGRELPARLMDFTLVAIMVLSGILKDLVFKNASIGKIVCSLRIVDAKTHNPVSLKKILLRSLIATEVVLNFFMYRKQGITLSDKICSTEVVRKLREKKRRGDMETGDGSVSPK